MKWKPKEIAIFAVFVALGLFVIDQTLGWLTVHQIVVSITVTVVIYVASLPVAWLWERYQEWKQRRSDARWAIKDPATKQMLLSLMEDYERNHPSEEK